MRRGHTRKIPFLHSTLKPLALGHAGQIHVLTGYEMPCVDLRPGWREVDGVIVRDAEFLDCVRWSIGDVALGIVSEEGFGDVLPFAFSGTELDGVVAIPVGFGFGVEDDVGIDG